MLLIGLSALALAIGLVVYLVGAPALAKKDVAVASHTPSVFPADQPDPEQRVSLLHRFAPLGAKLTRSGYEQRVQRRLDMAGNPRAWTPERMLALKGAGLVVGVLLGLLVGAKHGSAGVILIPAGLGAFGFFVPDIFVTNLGQKRQIDLQRALPDALDMLTVCVEAGMGFDSAMNRVARNLEGPAADEFGRVLQEMQFGMSRADALRSLVNRTDVAELRVFVSAMIQSTELGISMGEALRQQAKEMRIKRRQRAEEKAQKLQVKLLAPLITCLLPAMFIVVLGPAIIELAHFFAKTNS